MEFPHTHSAHTHSENRKGFCVWVTIHILTITTVSSEIDFYPKYLRHFIDTRKGNEHDAHKTVIERVNIFHNQVDPYDCDV